MRSGDHIAQGETAVSKEQCAPTLILHGAADEDVPPDQAKLFYSALQRLGVESSLVLYKGASHSVSAYAQMIDAASRVVVHFGDHLQLDPATVAQASQVLSLLTPKCPTELGPNACAESSSQGLLPRYLSSRCSNCSQESALCCCCCCYNLQVVGHGSLR